MGTLTDLEGALSPKEYQQLVGLIDGVAAATTMHEKVDSHLRFLEDAAEDDEFVEVDLGRAVAGVLHQLIASVDGLGKEEQQLVAAAVEYFVLAGDVDDDLRSPIGLEDDVRVVNVVATALGRDDLRI